MRLNFYTARALNAIERTTGHFLDALIWLMLDESADDRTRETHLSANRISTELDISRDRIRSGFSRLVKHQIIGKTERTNRQRGGFPVPIYRVMSADEIVESLGIAPHTDPQWSDPDQPTEPPF